MNQTAQKRSASLDLVRSVAVFSVICVHFFLNSGYYDTPMVGVQMYLLTFVRTGMMVCVPLFLILSGHLLLHKKPEWAYYITIIRTLGIYLLACIASFVYRHFIAAEELTLREYVSLFLRFELAEYGWYIEMYLGLFLLIPYVNILYHALGGQVQKRRFLVLLLVTTALPGILYIRSDLPIVPDWWARLYPITYYVIGAYLREYPLKWKPSTSILAFLLVCVIGTSYCFFLSYGQVFVPGAWQDWCSGILVALAVSLFHFLTTIDLRRMPGFLAAALARISDWSLGIYLVSSIFDNTFYPILNQRIPDMPSRFAFFPVIVLSVFLCSTVLSAFLHGIYKRTFERLLRCLKQRR